jgi:phosphomannomutase
MDVNPSIFKAYDIRGVYPDELNEVAAYRIGRAFVQFLKESPLVVEGEIRIVVTADARTSSPALTAELVRGMLDEDPMVRVIDGGLSTTPMHYFAINHANADGGIMVTASHNPSKYNGFKLSRRGAIPLGTETGLQDIQNTVMRGIFKDPEQRGTIIKQDFLKDYIDFLLAQEPAKHIRHMKIGLDLGNGMTGIVLPRLLKKLPLEYSFLYEDIDMTFPNHEANPINDETLTDLKKLVAEDKLDFGVAFDGDGDRMALVTTSGERIPGDFTLALLAQHFLEHSNGNKIVYDLRASKAVEEAIVRQGGIPIKSRVGHAFIKETMRKEDAILGGELSGHYYFKDFFYADSAILAFLNMLAFISISGKTLEELVAPLKEYFSSGEVNVEIEDRDKAIDNVAAYYKDDGEVSYLDGLSIAFADFWFNVRPSNTEPVLRFILEAKTKHILDLKVKELETVIKGELTRPA